MKKAIKLIVLLLIVVTSACAQVAIEKSTEKIVIEGNKYYLHTVESGHTLFSICKAYNVSEEDIENANENFNSNLQIGQVIYIPIFSELSEDGKYIVHIVKSGDTLYSLCLKYGAKEEEIVEINRKVKKNRPIKVGQEILFPINKQITQEPELVLDTIRYIYHTVEKGDTFYGLLRRYNVGKDDILNVNSDLDENKIRIGQIIKIPKGQEIDLTDQQRFIDSLAQVGFAVDSIVPQDTLSLCDSANWYTHGKDFRIIVLLPFEASDNLRNLYNQEITSKNQRLYLLTEKMVSFYAGLLVALEELESKDVNVDLEVFDIGKGNNVIADLLSNNKIDDVDLIIGPAFKSQIEFLNQNLNDTTVSIILPFVNDASVLKKYPNNIAVKTTEDIVCQNVAKYAALHPQNNYFVIQGEKSEQKEIAAYYCELLQKESDSIINVRNILFNGKSLVSLKSMISKDKENVFILPFAEEVPTMKIFTELFPLKNYEITLLGSKSILDFESIDPNYFKKVKYSYYSCQNIDYSDTLTNEFVTKYRDEFLCEPDAFSFIGYDIIHNILPKLIKHGKGFSECLNDEKFQGVSGEIQFIHNLDYAQKSYANKSLYIYRMLDDYLFYEIYPIDKTPTEEDLD